MKTSVNFMIVDDDETDNYISRRIIKQVFNKEDIIIFTDAKKALEHIKSEYSKPVAPETVLFLDTNMHEMTGWEFLEHFEKLDGNIKQLFKIYILSASDDADEIARATSNKNVTDYIIKPLTEQTMLSISIMMAKKVPKTT